MRTTDLGISIEFRTIYRHPFVGDGSPVPRNSETCMVRDGKPVPYDAFSVGSPNSNLPNHKTIPSGAGQERPHKSGARLGCGPAADTERVRELTTTHMKRTTWLRPCRRYRAGQGANDYRPRSSRLGCRPCRQIPICQCAYESR